MHGALLQLLSCFPVLLPIAERTRTVATPSNGPRSSGPSSQGEGGVGSKTQQVAVGTMWATVSGTPSALLSFAGEGVGVKGAAPSLAARQDGKIRAHRSYLDLFIGGV